MARRGDSDTLSTQVRERLRRDILVGLWHPGEKLQLAALSAHYETSSTVVREALTRLTGARLIELKPNRGFFVPTLSLDELRDFNELRCRAEEFGIKLAIERGNLQWESEAHAAHHTLERTPRHAEDGTGRVTEEWLLAHDNFHAKLLSSCGLPVLVELAATLADGNSLYRRWAVPTKELLSRDIEEEHREILKAATDRDADLAGKLLRQHYSATMELIMKAGLLPEATNGSSK
ncbi:GntR family transcriptional regulator [Mycetocola sp.]|uniref:GntR family transcriptional regulator n=1 Tax=Mycetocola sp. TaxID=1871042 RepID=UPI003988DA65